jgi:flagellar M-ring protein FliF
MNEQMKRLFNQVKEYWGNRTSSQKKIWITGTVSVVTIAILLTVLLSRTSFETLYTGLSPEETGQIKESLDSKGIKYEITNGGTTISVPSEAIDTLKVQLAAEGIPKSGSIDYSFFSENSGFGMTDNEFQVINREAMQTELSSLINSIEGIENSNVMINLPEKSVWVTDQNQTATASVVLDLKPGYQPDQTKINALYHLISKSVPSLPIDNIVIMDEFFNYYDIKNSNEVDSTLTTYEQQREIKQDIEQDIQRQIQQMLSTLMGPGKAIAIVTADIDFTKVKKQESLVEPVDKENMEGLEVSVERIRESYTGEGADAIGNSGTGDTDIAGYSAADNGNGEYERVEERINNEFNRIQKEVVESPYEIQDLGIQVMVEPPNQDEIPTQLKSDIEKILSSIVRTTINDSGDAPLTDAELGQKINVASHTFNGKAPVDVSTSVKIPTWYYIVGGLLLLIIFILLFVIFRKAKTNQQDIALEDNKYEKSLLDDLDYNNINIPDVNNHKKPVSEHGMRINQLEQMARDKPQEFAKLLRTWLSEE